MTLTPDDWRVGVVDASSSGGKAVLTAVILATAAVVAVVGAWIVTRRTADPFTRYYLRRVVHFGVVLVAVIAVAAVWRPFAGRIGLVLGLVAAGLAFAMQEVVGAVAGWMAVLSGRIYRIGDRIEIAGVRGDVVDITPLRTKILEIGEAGPRRDGTTWVRGRQLTGRVVSVSNKKTLTDEVYNYSAELEFIWEELTLPIAYRGDWQRAADIMEEEARAVSDQAAEGAMQLFMRKYPVRRADVTPRVFRRATDNYVELSARFPVSLRSARLVKDEMTRRVLERLDESGIEVASTSQDVTLRSPDDG